VPSFLLPLPLLLLPLLLPLLPLLPLLLLLPPLLPLPPRIQLRHHGFLSQHFPAFLQQVYQRS
jgi:hypothetical protein